MSNKLSIGWVFAIFLLPIVASAVQPEVVEETTSYRLYSDGSIELKEQDRPEAELETFRERELLDAVRASKGAKDPEMLGVQSEPSSDAMARGVLQENAVPGLWKGFGGVPYGCNGRIAAIEKGPNGKIYLAGEFSACNDVAANNIVTWDPLTNSFEALGSEMPGVDDSIDELAFTQEGDLIAVGNFRRAGTADAVKIARWDGAQWSAISNDFITGLVFAVAVDPESDDIYIGGSFDRIFTADGPLTVNNIAVWSGDSWGPLGEGTNGFVDAIEIIDGIVFAGGDFLQAGSQAVSHIASWDGNSWNPLDGGTDDLVSLFTTDGSNLFASGPFQNAGGVATGAIAQWDGAAWSSIDGPTNRIGGMDFGDGKLYITGGFVSVDGVTAPRVAAWDGAGWSGVGESAFNGFGDAIYADGDAVYVGGSFNIHGVIFSSDYPGQGFFANRLARFSIQDQTWEPMGSGDGNAPNGVVTSVVSTDEGIYIVGGGGNRFFDAVGTLITPWSFALWDGNQWSGVPGEPPCGGISFEELAASVTGSLLASIGCISLGDTEWGRTAMWDGVSWQPLASGFNGRVLELAVDGLSGDAYYGGSFTATLGEDPVAANHIARWDGFEWFSVGNGSENGVSSTTSPFSSVTDLAAQNNNLMVAGNFDRAGTVVIDELAFWNGSEWSVPGDGLNNGPSSPLIRDLVTAGGPIFAAGRFNRSGDQSLLNVAQWDGEQWLPLQGNVGEGVDFEPLTLDATQDLLYVAGTFGEAGGRPANRVARWDGTDWASLGSGASNGLRLADSDRRNPIEVIQSSREGIFIGGEFSGSSQVTAPNLIRFVPMENLDLDIETTVISAQNRGASSGGAQDGSVSYEILITNNGEFVLVDSLLDIGFTPTPSSIDWTCEPVAPDERGCPVANGSGPINLLLELPVQASLRFEVDVTAQAGSPFLDLEGTYRAAQVEGATGTLSDRDVVITPVSQEGIFKNDFE